MKAVTQLAVAVLLLGTVSLGANKLASGNKLPGIAFRPAAPTALDRVEIRVSGSAAGLCPGPTLLPQVAAGTLRLTLDPGICPPASRPASPRPFTARAAVGPLPPGTYAVDLVAGDAVAASAVLQVGPAEAAAGMPGRAGVGMLAVIVLLALAGAALLR